MSELGFFTKSRSPEAESPISKIFETVMHGNAQMASETAVKTTAARQVEDNSRATVTIAAAKGGGEPTVTVKNAPVSLLNNTQQQELETARDAPYVAVANTQAQNQPAVNDDAFAPIYEAVDKHLGYRVPRPSDPDIAEKLKTPDGIRELTREMGGGPADADGAIKALRAGQMSVPEMRERVAAFRAKKFAKIQETLQKPLDESQDIQQNELRAATERRMASQQYLAARNQLLDQKNVSQFGTADDFLSTAEKAMQEVGGFRDGDRELFRVSFLDERRKSLYGEEGRIAIQSYGSTPEELDRFVDEQVGPNLSDFERQQFRRTAKRLLDWRAAQEQKEKYAAANQRRADDRIALAIANANRSKAEKPEKPRKLTAFDTEHASTDALLSARGDSSFQQNSVEQAIRNRAGTLQAEVDKINAEMEANRVGAAQIRAQMAKPGFEDDESLMRQMTSRMERGRQMTVRWQQLQADIAKLNGGTTAQSEPRPDPLGIR